MTGKDHDGGQSRGEARSPTHSPTKGPQRAWLRVWWAHARPGQAWGLTARTPWLSGTTGGCGLRV